MISRARFRIAWAEESRDDASGIGLELDRQSVNCHRHHGLQVRNRFHHLNIIWIDVGGQRAVQCVPDYPALRTLPEQDHIESQRELARASAIGVGVAGLHPIVASLVGESRAKI